MAARTAVRLLVVIAISVLGLTSCGEESGSSTGESNPTIPAEEQPRSGNESIERFGGEAAGSERTAILEGFARYLEDLADRNYPAACAGLAAVPRQGLVAIAGQGADQSVTCPKALPLLLSPQVPAMARRQAEGKILRVRVDEDRAFVIFQAPGATSFQMPMLREGEFWKAGTSLGSVLVP